MFRRGLVLVSVALVSLATSAAGQSIAPLRLGVALGTSFGESEWWWPDGGHAALSLTSQGVGSRFGLRVEAIVDHNTNGARNDDGSRYTWQHSTMALTINTTYRLLGRSTGLYAIGGIGVYHRWNELRMLISGLARRCGPQRLPGSTRTWVWDTTSRRSAASCSWRRGCTAQHSSIACRCHWAFVSRSQESGIGGVGNRV